MFLQQEVGVELLVSKLHKNLIYSMAIVNNELISTIEKPSVILGWESHIKKDGDAP